MHEWTLVGLILVLGAGCGSPSGDGPKATPGQATASARAHQSLIQRGKKVFSGRCAVCHGEEARGGGPMATTIPPPRPADFGQDRYASMPTDTLRRVIMQGGAATGRNPRMPAWGDTLTDEQRDAVIAFIRSVARFGRVPSAQQIQDAAWAPE